MVSTRSQKGQSTNNATGTHKTPHEARPPARKSGDGGGQPSRKRTRTSQSDVEPVGQPTAGDGTVDPGLRERLLNLPVEIFGEICSFLDAIELHHLSLVDETFWSILISAKSDPLWRHAFGKVEPPIPECPRTMSGQQYARFMLIDSCMGCQVASQSVCFDYFHRVRYCQPCYRSNVVSETTTRKSHPDLPPEFLKYLSSEAVSKDGRSLVNFRPRWVGSKRQYHKATIVEVANLWTALSRTGNPSDTAYDQFMGRLERYANSRIEAGLKMKDWQTASFNWKLSQRVRLQSERRSRILAKLLELGHEDIDFPHYHSEVNKPVALTDEEWEAIRPSVERAAASNKVRRLQGLLWRRRNRRLRDMNGLWHGVVTTASGSRSFNWLEKAACLKLDDFLRVPSVAALLSVDTDGVPPTDIDSIRPEAFQLAIQGRRRNLTTRHNILKGLPVDHLDEEWSSLSDNETIARLDGIAAELALAVNGFWDSERKTVDWYPSPDLLSLTIDLGNLSPAESLAPGLAATMLESIGKGVDTEARAVVSQHYFQKPVYYRCTRCVEKVAPYLTFPELFSHFLEKRVWFDEVALAREALTESSSSEETQPSHAFFNDHDWDADGDLISSDSPQERARIAKLQHQLKTAYGNAPEDYEGEDCNGRSRRSANHASQRRTRRICRLCPEGYSPKPMYFATLKIHIETTHCKVVNVEEDTAVFDPRRDNLPVNPCVFDVPFLRL